MNESSINAGPGLDYNTNVRRSIDLAGEDVLTDSGLSPRDTGITGGTGSGYNPNTRIDRDNTTNGVHLNDDEGMIAGGSVSQIGSGYDKNIGSAEMTSRETGSGLTDNDSGMGSGYSSATSDIGLTGGASGMGSGYDSNTRDTGLPIHMIKLTWKCVRRVA